MQANVSNDLSPTTRLTITLPVVNQANPTAPANTTPGLSLGALLVKTDNAAMLEKVRTLMTLFDANVIGHDGGSPIGRWATRSPRPSAKLPK